MAFIPLNYEEGNIVELEVAATTFTKGDGCVFDGSGQMVKATAAAGVPIFYVIMEDVPTTATAGDTHLFYRTVNVPVFVVDTSGTPTQAQMGTYMDTVTNAGTIDEDASVDDLFFAEKIISAADKKVQGWFKGFTVES
jgi:L-ascorbate metabolism protein UlaG (beta-lactamase superfamily)